MKTHLIIFFTVLSIQLWSFDDIVDMVHIPQTDSTIVNLLRSLDTISSNQQKIAQLKKAKNIAQTKVDSSSLSLINKKTGVILYEEKHFKEAKNSFKLAIFYDSTSQSAADSYFNIALIHKQNRELDSMLWYIDKSIMTFNNLTEQDKNHLTFLKAGIILKNYGKHEDALKYLLQAYNGFDKLDATTEKSYTCRAIGSVQRLIGNLDVSEEYYRENLQLCNLIADTLQISNAHNSLGNLFNSKQEYDSAIYHYNKAIYLQLKRTNKKEAASMLHNLATVYYKKNETELAYDTYLKALQLKKKQRDSLAILYTINELIIVSAERGYHNQSLAYIDSANHLLDKQDNSDVVLRNIEAQTIYFASIRAYQQAYEKEKEYMKLYTQIFSEKQSQNVQLLQEQFESTKKENKINNLFESNLDKENIINKQFLDIQKKEKSMIILASLVLLSLGGFFYLKQRQKAKERALEFSRIEAVFKGQEIIKQHISKDLHDIVTTNYDGLRLKILALPKAKNFHELSETIVSDITEVNEQIRMISHRLSPLGDRIKQSSLNEIIISYLTEFQFYRKLFVHIKLPLPEELNRLKIESQTNLYGILLETLSNIAKHAEASRIEVNFEINNKQVTMSISDNGIGFTEMKNPGIGTMNMKQRADLLYGNCIISTNKGGTKVILSFPLTSNMP